MKKQPQLPRGIAPELLVSQVRNTMPYLFSPDSALSSLVPAQIVREFTQQALDHFEYFKLCVSSHYLSCATPVPTDVDNQIRFKLWPKQLPLETALQMAQFVLESRQWDFTQLSSRFVYGASNSEWKNQSLTGHHGEWFTVSAAAYCALKQYSDPKAQAKALEIFEQIEHEIRRQSEIFGSLWRANEGIACLKASASIAHNLGDLDRVMDMWDLFVGDPLRLEFYKLGASPFDSHQKLRYMGRLWVAGELYKSGIDGSSMAFENHRHFALRKPKCLRMKAELCIPTGPFFDDWGGKVVNHLDENEQEEVLDALIQGWSRLPKTIGYGRALHRILECKPGLLLKGLSKNAESVLKVTQSDFEKKWNDEALRLLDDIPSTA